ncbi:zinc-binding dehydrogenase [Leucobacter triazinivorans]|uniref:Alcohol dehydrogenase n=1 Tax=Leucobacter triazinivorans TaxID=1784719 RepID=A0A4V0Z1N9_9MICO|nr:zinc-binding dehydrogenase [Leucobacter triazinivorans]QBE49069.1 alcohol dehydrogenase [Leucobacter triazinivorans]
MARRVRAALAEIGATEFRVAEIRLRDPGPRDVVVELAASAFCISDWIALRGDMGLEENGTLPAVLGHSAVGTITEVGAESALLPGTRVVLTATPECGACFWCLAGRIDQCAGLFTGAPVLGTLADGREVFAPGATGAYAEATVIRDTQVWPVDDELPDAWLAMLGCGIVSGAGAVVNVAQVTPGSSVLVVGCGQIGLWMIQAARILGATTIIAAETSPARAALAARVGATRVVDPSTESLLDVVRAETGGRGADFGFDAGGTTDAVEQAFLGTRNGGVTTLTSYVARDTRVSLPLYDLALRGRDVRSSQSGRLDMRRDIARLLPWLADGSFDVRAMLGGIRPLDEIALTLAAARERREITPIISFSH